MYGMDTPKQNGFRQIPVTDLSADEKYIPVRPSTGVNHIELQIEPYWVPCFLPRQFEARN
jgi:hypothetical protein